MFHASQRVTAEPAHLCVFRPERVARCFRGDERSGAAFCLNANRRVGLNFKCIHIRYKTKIKEVKHGE